MNAMQPPQSIEEIKAGLETTEKGGVRQSIRNCLTVFQRDPLLSGAIAYNILTDRKDIIKPIGPKTQQELKKTINAMQPPQIIDEIKAGLETTDKGGVRQIIRNCLTVFQRDPLLSRAIAYNILTDRKDIIKPIGFHRESTALNDTDMKYLLLYLEETYGLTNEKKIDNAIGIVANENKYHPIRDYLNTLVWDGTERIRFCLRHFLGADADDYTSEALKLFLMGAISRAFQPGCKFEIML